ncbi:MAG TPA: aldehyde dehydrogenase family protein [Ramlibacter sp.]|nr:aldehyde dehydrogenase family protein [Ramlibacter sp.]
MTGQDPQYEGRMLIDGKLVNALSGKQFANINPATGAVIGHAADASPEDMSVAIGAARRAFDETDWSTNHAFRQRCLQQLQTALRENADRFRDIQVAEAGLTTTTASGLIANVTAGMSFMIDLCASYPYEKAYGKARVGKVDENRWVIKKPHGVAGLITAWNAPYLVTVWKMTPALAAGNCAVLKASPLAPFTATEIGRLIAERTDIPPGVINILTSGDRAEVGEALTGDPRVNMFSFTGSTKTGARVMQRAAEGIRKVELELSGKSANILLDDADLDVALPFSASMSCMLSGQGCALPTRLLVPDSLYDQVIERLSAQFKSMVVGDPRLAETSVGPVISRDQQTRILDLIAQGKAAGSRLVVGGGTAQVEGRLQDGYWIQPTLFADVAPDSVLAQTEIFGPVLSVIRYASEDEAVRIANGTAFGLAAYIQTRDAVRARALASKLRVGGVSLNGTVAFSHSDVPFGGVGISGLGRKNGVEGFEEYLHSMLLVEPA